MPLQMTLFFEIQNPLWPAKSAIIMMHGISLHRGTTRGRKFFVISLMGFLSMKFLTPFKGDFKGQHYNSKLPPFVEFSNNRLCETFDQFITETILERLRNGSISIWGKCGHCTPPHIVIPLTVEPKKPRLCHDERYLNLPNICPKIKFDPITDLSSCVGNDHYQAKLDDKSRYDRIKLAQESKT